MKKHLTIAAGLIASAALMMVASPAMAHVDVGVNIGIPGFFPAPVYVEPQPVYVQRQPEYIQSRPIYVEGEGGNAWREHEWRERRSHARQWQERHEHDERHRDGDRGDNRGGRHHDD